ncbi:OLC1v1009341C1 [Oldenlandia corymbosa var. corymbosa]|uniref:OLC1v1009341C1 n=1 Tax=Oldenlandia corymbosa var. corymbosa TaxID=529605 RepID=A0AAV1DR57_OLDCO|nr:OLC1v1009341C1 [Oldenlandia corymbosa var. corymbosa]
MDEEPIKSSSSSRSNGHDEVKKVLEELIRKDDEGGFVSFIRSYSENRGFRAIEQHYDDLMMWICSYSARRCATALLKGETGLAVDLNVPLRNGCYPLHLAAENLCSGLMYLFLHHGAHTDLQCGDKDSKYFRMLPLSVALEALRYHKYLSDWNPSISVFKLIYCLCFRELQEPLKTVKILSEKTQELENISFSLVREGKLVELAGLLFVAWNKLLAPPSDDNVDCSAIGQCVMESLASLIDQEYKLVNTGRNEALFRVGMKARDKEELLCSIDQVLLSRQRQISSTSFDGSRKQKDLVSKDLASNHLLQAPSSRAFHTCQIPRSLSIPKLYDLSEAHHRMNNITSKQPNVLSAMRWAYYGLTLMRLWRK